MSVHKTVSNTFEVRWRENKKAKTRAFKRKIDAQKFDSLKKLGISNEEALDRMGLGAAIEKSLHKSEMRFSRLSEIWLRDHASVHKSPSSIIRDKQILRDYLLPAFGSKAITEIQMHDIVRLQSTLKSSGQLKPKSINNIKGLLHKIFDDAVNWGHAKSNPVEKVKNIKLNETEYKFWNFQQRDRFLSYVKVHRLILFRVVGFTVHTGLRKGEVEGLYRDCIDFERREITVKRSFCDKTKKLNEYTKGKNIRRVPMNDEVFEILQFCRDFEPDQKIFDINFHDFNKQFCRWQIKAGVPVISFHDLRHTFASLLAMAGVSVFIIQKLLGHSDLKTTMRYMHLAPGHLTGTTDALITAESQKKLVEYGAVYVQKIALDYQVYLGAS